RAQAKEQRRSRLQPYSLEPSWKPRFRLVLSVVLLSIALANEVSASKAIRTDRLRLAPRARYGNPAASTLSIDRARRQRLRGECRGVTKCLCRAPQAGSSPTQ